MCLETLEGVKEIGGFKVDFWPEDRNSWSEAAPIIVNKNTNAIAFLLQNGPIKEVGVNGCQIETIIEAAKILLEGLNKKVPCDENEAAIQRLDLAMKFLNLRKEVREQRGVEGEKTPDQIDELITVLDEGGGREACDEDPPPPPDPLPYVELSIMRVDTPYQTFSRRAGDILRVRFAGYPPVEFDDIVLPMAGYYSAWIVDHADGRPAGDDYTYITWCKGNISVIVRRVV